MAHPVNSMVKRQMMCRCDSLAWVFRRRRFGGNLLIPMAFRVGFHTEDGHAQTILIGNPGDITSYSNFAGTIISHTFDPTARCWRYAGNAEGWEVEIFQYSATHDAMLNLNAVNVVPRGVPAGSDAGFYMLGFIDGANVNPLPVAPITNRSAFWTANRLIHGGPPDDKGNYTQRANSFLADGGFGGVFLDEVTITQTYTPPP